jgi:hypothetical protein
MSRLWEKLPADRKTGHEIWGGVFLLHAMGLLIEEEDKLKPQEITEARGFLGKVPPPERALHQLSGDGSWNTPQIALALHLWAGTPGTREVILQYLRWQVGEQAPPADRARLGFLGGSEPVSGNYAHWRAGAVAAWLVWAERNADGELAALCRRWILKAAALVSLLTCPRTSTSGPLNARGELIDRALVELPIGERYNPAHLWSDNRVLLMVALGLDSWQKREAEWPIRIAKAVKDLGVSAEQRQALVAFIAEPWVPANLAAVAQLLQGTRISSVIRVRRYASAAVAWQDERNNGNTPAYMGAALDLVTGKLTTLYPWPPGRAFGAKGRGWCGIRDGKLVAETQYGGESLELPAGEPLIEYSIGPEGLVVAGAQPVPVPPVPGPEVKPEPPKPDKLPLPKPPKVDHGAELRTIATRLLEMAREMGQP